MSRFSSILAATIGIYLSATLPGSAQDSTPTIDSIRKAGVLRVGMADSLPAQQRHPVSGQWEGFNVDMAENLAGILGVDLEIVDTTWGTIIPGLLQGQYDIAMVDMFRTPERAITVDFTDSYMTTGNTWLVRGDLELDDWTQLNDSAYTIVSIAGMASVAQSERLLPNAQLRTIVSDNAVAAHLEVMAGRADAHLSDYLQNLLFMQSNSNANVKILGAENPIEATGYSYAIRQNDYPFMAFLNTWIAHADSTGFLSERMREWYGKE